MTLIHRNVEACRAGTFPPQICRVPSGWAVLSNMQYLPGYTILLPDPVVPDLNALDRAARAAYLLDMAGIGDALLEVTGAYRINYAVLGNTDPVLHAHIIPRFRDEPEDLRKGLPWVSYDQNSRPLDLERDEALIKKIALAIQKRIT